MLGMTKQTLLAFRTLATREMTAIVMAKLAVRTISTAARAAVEPARRRDRRLVGFRRFGLGAFVGSSRCRRGWLLLRRFRLLFLVRANFLVRSRF